MIKTNKKSKSLKIAHDAFFGEGKSIELGDAIFEAFNRVVIPEIRSNRSFRPNYSDLTIFFSFQENKILVMSEKEFEDRKKSSNLVFDDLIAIFEIKMSDFYQHQLFQDIVILVKNDNIEDKSSSATLKEKVRKLFFKIVQKIILNNFLKLSEIDFDEIISSNDEDYRKELRYGKFIKLISEGCFPVRVLKKESVLKFFLNGGFSTVSFQEIVKDDHYLSLELKDYLISEVDLIISSVQDKNNSIFFDLLIKLGRTKILTLSELVDLILIRFEEIQSGNHELLDSKTVGKVGEIFLDAELLDLNNSNSTSDFKRKRLFVEEVSVESLVRLLEFLSQFENKLLNEESDSSNGLKFRKNSQSLPFATLASILELKGCSGVEELSINENYLKFLSHFEFGYQFISKTKKLFIDLKPSSLIDFSSMNSILDRLNGLKNPFTISKAAEDNLELLVDAINKGAVLSSDGIIEKRLIELDSKIKTFSWNNVILNLRFQDNNFL